MRSLRQDSAIIPSQPNFLQPKVLTCFCVRYSKITDADHPRLRIDGIFLLSMVDNAQTMQRRLSHRCVHLWEKNPRVQFRDSVFGKSCGVQSLSGESIFSHERTAKVAAAYEALTKEVTEIEERAKNRSGPDRVR
jgi:chromosome partitioning protein